MDGINSKILKVICNSIAPPLAHIFNLSFTTGEVPELLKVAKVIPYIKRVKEINLEIIALYLS